MKRAILLSIMALLTLNSLQAQTSIDEMYFNARGSFAYNHDDDSDTKGFAGEYFNFVIAGQIDNNLSFRIRQRFNKQIVKDNNPFNATDFLYIDWKIDDNWSFTFGKQAIAIGGYEYDYAPIDVYYYSDFCDRLPECYAFGATMSYKFNENQLLMLQVTNSPFKGGFSDLLTYNLAWYGQIAPWWKTIWSVNEAEYKSGDFFNYIALGNKFIFGDFYLDLDVMNRYMKDYDDFLAYDWNVVAKLNYNYKNYNFFVKGGYDEFVPYGSLIDGGYPYDPNAQEDYTHIGAGVEYFPLNNENLRLHAVYSYQDREERHTILLGATWKFNMIKK